MPGTWAVSPNALTASFTPTDTMGNTVSLGVGRAIQFGWAGSVTNLVGNGLQGGSLTFNTALTPSSTTPQVTFTNPENNQTLIPINGIIQVLFNEPVQSSSVSDVSLSLSGTPVAGVVNTLSQGNTLLTLTPPALLQGTASYAIDVTGVKDAAGNVLSPGSYRPLSPRRRGRICPTPVSPRIIRRTVIEERAPTSIRSSSSASVWTSSLSIPPTCTCTTTTRASTSASILFLQADRMSVTCSPPVRFCPARSIVSRSRGLRPCRESRLQHSVLYHGSGIRYDSARHLPDESAERVHYRH